MGRYNGGITDTLDLHTVADFERENPDVVPPLENGEHLVVLTEGKPEVRWMTPSDGRFTPMSPEEGLIKSRIFPGLWLDADALLSGDLPKLIAAVEKGCATDSHAAFVERLGAARG